MVKKKQERRHYLTDSEELASGMIYHKNRGGNKRKIPFSPAQKATVPKSHTHTQNDRTFMEAFLGKTMERTYIFKSHTI